MRLATIKSNCFFVSNIDKNPEEIVLVINNTFDDDGIFAKFYRIKDLSEGVKYLWQTNWKILKIL